MSMVQLISDLSSRRPVRVVFLGDSITKGVRAATAYQPAVTCDEIFVARVASAMADAGIRFDAVNAGVGSDRTDGALARIDDLLKLQPDIVVVMYGTNDSCIDLGTEDPRLTIAEYESNLRILIARIRSAGAEPVLMTEPALGSGWFVERHRVYVENGQNYSLRPFMQIVRQVAEDTHTPLIDHFTDWESWGDAEIERHLHDGCHPNALGQARLADKIFQFFLPQPG